MLSSMVLITRIVNLSPKKENLTTSEILRERGGSRGRSQEAEEEINTLS